MLCTDLVRRMLVWKKTSWWWGDTSQNRKQALTYWANACPLILVSPRFWSLFNFFNSFISRVLIPVVLLLPEDCNWGIQHLFLFGVSFVLLLDVCCSGKNRAQTKCREPSCGQMVSFFFSHYTVQAIFTSEWQVKAKETFLKWRCTDEQRNQQGISWDVSAGLRALFAVSDLSFLLWWSLLLWLLSSWRTPWKNGKLVVLTWPETSDFIISSFVRLMFWYA